MQGTVLSKAFRALNLFQNKTRGFTAIELSQELGVSVRTAYYYLEQLSLHFPIAKNDTGPARYRLMEHR